jgi:hypothetical protein
MVKWSVDPIQKGVASKVTTIRVELPEPGAVWECLVRSDAHHDNAHCNVKMEKAHLDYIQGVGGAYVDLGDQFCGMQGKHDKRADKGHLKPNLERNDYVNALVEDLADFYLPYAKSCALLTQGNHESKFLKHEGVDLPRLLHEQLKGEGSPAHYGGHYQGWVVFQFSFNKTKRKSFTLNYTHGSGTGGQVTGGMIAAHRILASTAVADIYASGHTHDHWHRIFAQEALDHKWQPYIKRVHVIKVGGYKDEYSAGSGWVQEKGIAPKPMGAWLLRFWQTGGNQPTVDMKVVEA